MRALLIVASLVVAGFLVWNAVDRERAARRERDEASKEQAAVESRSEEPAKSDTRAAPWRVHGRVTDSADRAIAGARVRVFIQRGDVREPWCDAVSDAAGEYDVDLEPVRRASAAHRFRNLLVAEAFAHGYIDDAPAELAMPVDPMEACDHHLDRALHSGAALHGRAVDDRGRPVPYAYVALRDRDSKRAHVEWRTDTDGGFVAWSYRKGSYDVAIERPGVGRAVRRVEIERFAAHDLGDLTLGGGTAMEGVVLFPDGSPAPHAAIDLADDGVDDDWNAIVVADADGRFRATGLATVRYLAYLEEDLTAETQFEVTDPSRFVRLVAPVPRVSIAVVAEDGRPVAPAPLAVAVWTGAAAEEAHRLYAAGASLVPLLDRALIHAESDVMTRRDGRADAYVREGSFVLASVVAKGFAPQTLGVRATRVGDHPLRFVMRAVATGSLETTFHVGGEPVPHLAHVFEARSGAPVAGALFGPLAPGRYIVKLSASDGLSFPGEREVVVRANEVTQVRVEGRPGARLGLRFNGKPPAIDAVWLEDEEMHFWMDDYEKSHDLYPPGRYRLRIEFEDDRPLLERQVDLIAGRVTVIPVD